MINQWLSWLNACLLGIALVCGLFAGYYWIQRPREIAISEASAERSKLPKGAFELPISTYEKIGGPLLALEQAPPALQVPDLKQQLIYYGKNGRPDAQSTHTLLHFCLGVGNKNVVSIQPEEKLYLVFDKKSVPPRYTFSPQNEKTSLWIEATPIDNEVAIQVTLENNGELIREPESCANFRLPEKEFIRFAGLANNWEIGSFRVDGTLLARQKARWYGPDRFLERHGGSEYAHIIDKQRVDFGEGDDVYSVFVKIGNCLIWKDNQWQCVQPGEDSLGHPLLTVKKIDERLMTFELWDVEGKGKILLNLLKSMEPWTMQNAQVLQNMFKFVGARTKTQAVFEVNRERMVLSPSDWLLLTSKGWKKLETADEIDDYVKRKSTGTLFVFEGITRKDERQVMKGALYNPSRTDYELVEVALQTNHAKATSHKDKDQKEAQESEEDKEAREVAELVGELLAPLMRSEGDIHSNPLNGLNIPPSAIPSIPPVNIPKPPLPNNR